MHVGAYPVRERSVEGSSSHWVVDTSQSEILRSADPIAGGFDGARFAATMNRDDLRHGLERHHEPRWARGRFHHDVSAVAARYLARDAEAEARACGLPRLGA